MTIILRWITALALCLVPALAQAHPIQQSLVEVRVQDRVTRMHLILPSVELVYALIEEGAIARPQPGFLRYPDAAPNMVRAYVASHLAVTGTGGAPLPITITRLIAPPAAALDGAPDKDWQVDVLVPNGAKDGAIAVHYGVITREVFNHVAVFSLSEDWRGGVLPDHPRIIGQVGRGEQVLTITPGSGRAWQSWWQMIALGLWHIAEGSDHQAFLIAVLLTVGLVARGRRWQCGAGWRPLLSDTLWRISAFTLGHSLSLLFTSLGWLPAGGQIIEVLIAVSVAVSAIHAIVPIYPGRESWIAAFFGTIPGMAFATAIRDMALPTGEIVSATLAFNIGIELAQLALVAVALPLLLLARRSERVEPVVRTLVGLAIFAMALVWIGQRA